jgi:hypothetical protein
MWIRDLGWKECGSGIEKFGIRNTDCNIVPFQENNYCRNNLLLVHSHCSTRTHTHIPVPGQEHSYCCVLQDQFKIIRTSKQCCGSGMFSPDLL